jgi:D-alanyl-D-alanine carboxypeptidase/D-alanyl-D-alanine-endopeptidase (penicillin-binding protein 4)
MKLIDAPCAKWEDGWKLPTVTHQANGKLRVTLQGTFPKNCNTSYSINVIDRHDYVDRLVRSTWRRLGGSITGATVEGSTPLDARLLAEHQSRALPEIVRDINKLSDNTLARSLFLSLGSQIDAHQEGLSTLVRADLAVRRWMRAQGIDDAAMVTENGSGLSRLERLSARQLAGVLQAGLRSQWAPELLASMPIVAVDGTMRRRLHDSPAAGRARLKTGTLNGVVASAGYVTDTKGQRWVVVAMLNGESLNAGRGSRVVDALIDWVARHGG